MLRTVFMGTPEFAVPSLEALQRYSQVVGVYTQPDRPVGRGLETQFSPVKQKALDLNLPIFQPERLSQDGEFEKLQELKPDLILVVAYGQILKKNVLSLPRLGCVNIHASLLPRWRGAAPIQWALLSGDRETGVCTMEMVSQLDAGGVYLEKKTPIGPQDTAQTLHDRLKDLGADLVAPTLEGLESGKLRPISQDENRVTYAKKLTKEMQWLDSNEKAIDLDRKIRALNPWPGTSVSVEALGRLKILSAQVRSELSVKPGEIDEKSGMLLLGTAQGALELKRVQWEGKKPMEPSSFLNGLVGRKISLPIRVQNPDKTR